nr:hypothetical protein [Tanacetum cinerariifolium]
MYSDLIACGSVMVLGGGGGGLVRCKEEEGEKKHLFVGQCASRGGKVVAKVMEVVAVVEEVMEVVAVVVEWVVQLVGMVVIHLEVVVIQAGVVEVGEEYQLELHEQSFREAIEEQAITEAIIREDSLKEAPYNQVYQETFIPQIYSQPTQQSAVYRAVEKPDVETTNTTADIEEAPVVETTITTVENEETQVEKGNASATVDKGKAPTVKEKGKSPAVEDKPAPKRKRGRPPSHVSLVLHLLSGVFHSRLQSDNDETLYSIYLRSYLQYLGCGTLQHSACLGVDHQECLLEHEPWKICLSLMIKKKDQHHPFFFSLCSPPHDHWEDRDYCDSFYEMMALPLSIDCFLINKDRFIKETLIEDGKLYLLMEISYDEQPLPGTYPVIQASFASYSQVRLLWIICVSLTMTKQLDLQLQDLVNNSLMYLKYWKSSCVPACVFSCKTPIENTQNSSPWLTKSCSNKC